MLNMKEMIFKELDFSVVLCHREKMGLRKLHMYLYFFFLVALFLLFNRKNKSHWDHSFLFLEIGKFLIGLDVC